MLLGQVGELTTAASHGVGWRSTKWLTRAPCAVPAAARSEPLSMADLLALADEDALERWGGLRLAYTGACAARAWALP